MFAANRASLCLPALQTGLFHPESTGGFDLIGIGPGHILSIVSAILHYICEVA